MIQLSSCIRRYVHFDTGAGTKKGVSEIFFQADWQDMMDYYACGKRVCPFLISVCPWINNLAKEREELSL